MDNRNGFVVRYPDRCAQHLMSRDDDIQSAFQRVDIEFTEQPKGFRFVIDRQPWVHLLQKPQPPLAWAEGTRQCPITRRNL